MKQLALLGVLEPQMHALPSPVAQEPRHAFNGPAYAPEFDYARLTGQLLRVFDLMKDGHWRTLEEISIAAHAPAASVSAQLRHLRKRKYGGWQIDKRARGERARGLWEYRLDTRKPEA